MDDFSKMEIPQLCMKLEMIARTTHYEKAYRDYALSTDNLLKMALMLLRTRALLPVVLCGEAGCGKVVNIYIHNTVCFVSKECPFLPTGFISCVLLVNQTEIAYRQLMAT